jgi:hypothetical protein
VPLIQMRQQHLKPQCELIQNILGEAHTRRTILSYKSNNLFLYDFTAAATIWRRCPPRRSRRCVTRTGRSSTPTT